MLVLITVTIVCLTVLTLASLAFAEKFVEGDDDAHEVVAEYEPPAEVKSTSHDNQIIQFDFSQENDSFIKMAQGKTISEVRELAEEYKQTSESLEKSSLQSMREGFTHNAESEMKKSLKMKARAKKLEMIISEHRLTIEIERSHDGQAA